jgi:hypothetical protein
MWHNNNSNNNNFMVVNASDNYDIDPWTHHEFNVLISEEKLN